MAELFRTLRFYRSERSSLGGMLVLLLLSVCLNLLKPWPVAWLVDFLLQNRDSTGYRWVSKLGLPAESIVGLLALATLACYLTHPLVSALHSGCLIRLGLRGLSRVRSELLAHLQRLPWRFHQQIPSGDLIYRASWDTYAIQTLFQQGVGVFLSALLSLFLMTVVMSRLDGVLTLIALGTAPLIVMVIRVLGPNMGRLGTRAQQADSAVTSRAQQIIQSLPLIQSYTREAQEEETFQGLIHTAQEDRWRQHRSELKYGVAVAAVFAVGISLLVWVGGGRVVTGHLTAGELVVFLAYLAQFYEPLNQLSHVGSTLATAGASAKRVFEVLDAPAESPDVANPTPMPQLVTPGSGGAWSLEFRQVSFEYRPGERVLDRVSFSVQAGDLVAVIGPSGAGKSTLLHLLPRFFDPTEGSLLLAGVDLTSLRRHELRSQVAMLMQEPFLFQGTVAENIGFGRVDATRTEIETAAREANAHDFIIRLEHGYDTVVGDGSQRLSVGEKQRVHLARAFLKQAPILILDEPTSSLDAESERLVVESLGNLVGKRTTFMVAHRLQTLRIATKVLVLEKGKVLEFGTPQELLARNGYFASVYRPGSLTN